MAVAELHEKQALLKTNKNSPARLPGIALPNEADIDPSWAGAPAIPVRGPRGRPLP